MAVIPSSKAIAWKENATSVDVILESVNGLLDSLSHVVCGGTKYGKYVQVLRVCLCVAFCAKQVS